MSLSGQITVTTAGAAVQGTDIPGGLFCIKAHPDNTDTVWVGEDGAGDVSSSNGFPLNSGEAVVLQVANLNHLWFDADVDGEKICWLALD
jgi:hypothetical protein